MTNTQTDQFSAPGKGGDSLPVAELLGSLLLFTVDSIQKDIETVHGISDAIRANVAALDGDMKGQTWDDTLIFQRVLQSQLRGAVGGSMVLGRLEQGAKKPGKNPPYQLADPTEAERETARKYLAHVATQAPAPVVVEEPF